MSEKGAIVRLLEWLARAKASRYPSLKEFAADERPNKVRNLCRDESSGSDFCMVREYRSQILEFHSALKFLLSELTFGPYMAHLAAAKERAVLKRKLRTSIERIDALRAAVEWQKLQTGNQSGRLGSTFSNVALLEKIHGRQIWALESLWPTEAELTFVLESLVDSGELGHNGQEYFLKGKALQTIAEFEEDNRRNRVAEKSNRNMVVLTGIIAFATALQFFPSILLTLQFFYKLMFGKG